MPVGMMPIMMPECDANVKRGEAAPKLRVYAIIDGFNMYHALDRFDHGKDEAEQGKYKQYKWLCFRTLLERHIDTDKEELTTVHYFTALPGWNQAKLLRHQGYLNALRSRGVIYTLGEFKVGKTVCKGTCKETYEKNEEKQTDVNIATTIISAAEEYDILILLTADSDQVPAIRLLKKLHPEKVVYILPPIGRNSKELIRAAGKNSRKIMTEDDLKASQLPNPVDVIKDGKVSSQLWKPAHW
jgi:uncharacterized LabA/DUF88 family protein